MATTRQLVAVGTSDYPATADATMAISENVVLDAHARPPESLRVRFKNMQKLSPDAIDDDPEILDFNKPESTAAQTTCKEFAISRSSLRDATSAFLGKADAPTNSPMAFEINSCPGAVFSDAA